MFIKLFFLWAPCAAALGYFFPQYLDDQGGIIVPLLSTIMLCMGLTLGPKDFVQVADYKKAILAGVLLQFTVMPLLALTIANVLALGPELTVGLVLVGSVAGGTASNVITYLARGHVAMSVSMTAISTLASVVMTPLLLELLVGTRVPVPALDMLISLLKIVLVPVSIGVLLNYYAHQWVAKIEPALALLAVVFILLVIAIVVALNVDNVATVAGAVIVATLLHNIFGLVLGYLAAWLLGFDRVVCRTIAIEVGMQNSGLAAALALKFFSPIASLPGVIFSIWLNITGSAFASLAVKMDSQAGDRST